MPVFPYIFLSGTTAVITSMIFSSVGLIIIDAGITLFTSRNLMYSGTRQVMFGLAEALVTFGIGRLVGANLGG